MKFIFCNDLLNPRKPDEAYAAEADAVTALGWDYTLISYEALVNEGNATKAVRRVSEADAAELGIYRGWMLRPAQYTQLYEALAGRGIRLINDPGAYVHCHYLPESYPVIAEYTPRTIWMPVTDDVAIDEVMVRLRPFGTAPLVLKDFVKSQKYYWHDACFIPSAGDQDAVERVVRRFLLLQGADLNEGLVFREFIEFAPLATHSKTGMPLTTEFRVFVLDGDPLCIAQYWDEGDYGSIVPPIEQFRGVMQAVKSRFFTMDVAQRANGDWMIVELGDAQVAGLPDTLDVAQFYNALDVRLHMA